MSGKEIRKTKPPPQGPVSDSKSASAQSIDPRILTIARAIGRQIAQERLKALQGSQKHEPSEIQKQTG
jgi:hypothetical protein